MKKERNELLQLLAGLAMLVAGLFIFSQKVMVSSGFFGYGWSIGGMRFGNGLIIVPLIIGIVWMFGSGGSFLSKLFTVAAVLIIIAAVVMSTNIRLTSMSLYDWILILVLIFGGAAMLARLLMSDRGGRKERKELDAANRKIREMEDELERMKKGR